MSQQGSNPFQCVEAESEKINFVHWPWPSGGGAIGSAGVRFKVDFGQWAVR